MRNGADAATSGRRVAVFEIEARCCLASEGVTGTHRLPTPSKMKAFTADTVTTANKTTRASTGKAMLIVKKRRVSRRRGRAGGSPILGKYPLDSRSDAIFTVRQPHQHTTAMPGRKKGRQRGASGSKAQSARKWNDAMREARDELSWGRKQKIRGDAAPPRLSPSGFRSLATLLRQRAHADEIGAAAAPPLTRPQGPANQSAAVALAEAPRNNCTADWADKDSRPRKTRTLMHLCINQIGKDFLAYRADDDAVAQVFQLLPPPCLSRLSRSASARGTISDDNIGLLCSPGVDSLWLRGRFTDQGAGALLPGLHATDTPGQRKSCIAAKDAIDLAEACRDSGRIEGGDGGAAVGETQAPSANVVSSSGDAGASGEEEEEEEEEEDEWETAGDRIEISLRGGVSLTSLDLSSPRISVEFVRRLAVRIPSLRRLGLRGSLGVVGGPDAVCDHVPRLTALRELDVSYCTWFCDLTLRRLAKAISCGCSPARTKHPNEHSGGLGQREITTAERLADGTSGWGSASKLATIEAVPSGEGAGWGAAGAEDVVPLEEGSGSRLKGSPRRFRTFTVVCERTAVTGQGARQAEALSPGLMVITGDQS